tara:strand:+ start:1961 stop:2824 length:864 start_codon:yes stop_codon:yes gene_type:complete
MRNSTKTYQLISETFLQIINEEDWLGRSGGPIEGWEDRFVNATPEQKRQLRQMRIKDEGRAAQQKLDTMRDQMSPEQRIAFAMGETDAPNTEGPPSPATEYERALRGDLGQAVGRANSVRYREREAKKREDPVYDAMTRMRRDQRAIDRASDALIASDSTVRVSQQSSDKAFQDSLRNLGGPRRYLDDPDFSMQGYSNTMRRLGYEDDPYTGQPVQQSPYAGSSDEYLNFTGQPLNEPVDPSTFPRGRINPPAPVISQAPPQPMTSPTTLQDRKRFEDRPNYSGYFA